MKGEVSALIKELKGACRRPLFKGIQASSTIRDGTTTSHDNASGPLTVTPSESTSEASETGSTVSAPKATPVAAGGAAASKRSHAEAQQQHRGWHEILADAAPLLPFMTEDEHGTASRLAGILLLGFLLPQSTGSQFFLLENLSSKRLKKKAGNASHATTFTKSILSGVSAADYVDEKEDMGEYILQMPLEERLEACPHRYHPDEFGEFNSIVFDPLEDAFRAFLRQGLAPFLSGRPAHTSEVDLIHILAMAIHPQPSEQAISQTASKLDEEDSESWDKAKRLMSNLTAPSFHVNYTHRLHLVRLVTDCLVVPIQTPSRTFFEAPLFYGALPHLRAALYAFGMASIHPLDEHIAWCGIVSVAIQSGIDYVVKEEWNRLSHKLVDDQANYPCCPHCQTGKKIAPQKSRKLPTYGATFSLFGDGMGDCFCPHKARGRLMREFICRYNEARCFADPEFLNYALSSISDAIEMQVDLWTQGREEDVSEHREDDDATMENGTVAGSSQPPCVLASLLSSAKCLFHFILPTSEKQPAVSQDEEKPEESEESRNSDMLISCGVQLLHHWDPVIVEGASTMLLLAFSYAEEMWNDNVSLTFASFRLWVEGNSNKIRVSDDSLPIPIEGLVSAYSQRSQAFAARIMQFLLHYLNQKDIKNTESIEVCRLVAAVSIARPSVAEQNRHSLVQRLQTVKSAAATKHILTSLLACRKARFFVNEDEVELELLALVSDSKLDKWQEYQIGRFSMTTGNFAIAKTMYEGLAQSVTSESSYVWLHALQQVCEGEAATSVEGSKALRDASSNLTMAMCTLRSLPTMMQLEGVTNSPCNFQVRFLELRVSFLDLLTAARQQTRELRLIGQGPKRNTRPYLHLKNVARELFVLCRQYSTFYKQHGLFICQQSRSVLRTISISCSFIGKALQRVFQELSLEKAAKNGPVHTDSPSGDPSEPLTLMIKQLESIAVQPMDSSVDPKIRATALLEIMDGILKVPKPFPRAFFVMKSIPRSVISVTWDPKMHDQIETSHLRTAALFSLVASGNVEKEVLARACVPFSVMLLWYTLTPKEKRKSENKQNVDTSGGTTTSLQKLLNPPPIATALSSSGKFFLKIPNQSLPEVGKYEIDFRLGCRDIRGGEWELPMKMPPAKLTVELLKSS